MGMLVAGVSCGVAIVGGADAITINEHGQISEDIPPAMGQLRLRWCPVDICPVCHERTNEEWRVWLPSTKLLHGEVIAPHWLPGHLPCYPQLADEEMKWRRSQNEWRFAMYAV